MNATMRQLILCLPLTLLLTNAVPADDLDRAPIHYSSSVPRKNPIAELQERLNSGKVRLSFADEKGYLESLLRELKIPVSSQVLVFTKTSLQRDKISPRLPRALYFNDECYIGFVRVGEVLEISTIDGDLGNVFYTLKQQPSERPRFERQSDHCLTCHTSRSAGVPANVVRSVHSDRHGNPILSAGSTRVDHATPFEKRWGGWYVTGTHGKQLHLGNTHQPRFQVPDDFRNEAGANLTKLDDKFDTGAYLSPHSDLVALMLMEHQAEMHNRFTAAQYQTKYALRDAEIINELDGKPKSGLTESTSRRIDAAADQVVRFLLFCEEAPLSDPVRGTSRFAEEFTQRGPKDKQGRSLREFDLNTRLMKYPCSYLIYSPAFDSLPPLLLERIYRQLSHILQERDRSPDFAHLSSMQRKAIREILKATKPGLPADF